MADAEKSSILGTVANYYTDKLAEHGATPRGVDWRDHESHRLRHLQFLRLLDGADNFSLSDLGCGYGDFYDFLKGTGRSFTYFGYDVSRAMIDAAGARHGHVAGRVEWRNSGAISDLSDFIVASGIFNVKLDAGDAEWRAYIDATLDMLFQKSRIGFGFNVLSLHSDADRRRRDLFYADPAEMLHWCATRYGRRLAVLQDYGLYEFTVLVRK